MGLLVDQKQKLQENSMDENAKREAELECQKCIESAVGDIRKAKDVFKKV